MQKENIPEAIYLYDEGFEGLSFKELEKFIKKNFGKIRVRLIKLKKEAAKTRGLLFDHISTLEAFEDLSYSKFKDSCHIILTKKLISTNDEGKRPHIRAAVFGYPSVISSSGIVEGPAKPREFYIFKQKYAQLGLWPKEEGAIKKKFKGQFIDYGDKRMPEVLKGYVAQAIFFNINGEPFCKKRACRLFNSHWQQDIVYSQLRHGTFCAAHRKALKEIKEKNS